MTVFLLLLQPLAVTLPLPERNDFHALDGSGVRRCGWWALVERTYAPLSCWMGLDKGLLAVAWGLQAGGTSWCEKHACAMPIAGLCYRQLLAPVVPGGTGGEKEVG